jgi:hypothetical protein
VGINLPPVATVVSSGPAYYPAPAYVAPTYYPSRSTTRRLPTIRRRWSTHPRVYAPRPRVWVAPVFRPFYGAPGTAGLGARQAPARRPGRLAAAEARLGVRPTGVGGSVPPRP